MNKDDFLKISDHNELASLFGMTYPKLAKIIYQTDDDYKYHQFQISKKNGSHREIASPSKKLKKIQFDLKEVLYEIYPTKPSAHGFAKDKSIVTNAEMHLDKKFIFNIDLSDFFGTIHFGRIRNLFKSSPFNFNHTVSTILAQVCIFKNSLPQGAPTSPILSNMIAWKLDSQLQHLAKITSCTYTRYVDDISFSFTCNKHRLPKEVVIIRDEKGSPGNALTHIINENGFNINHDKVRLCSTLSRMEVTGITVNEFLNVKRKYIRQISSILHAWRKYGYEATEKEFNDIYDLRQRASDTPKSLLYVVKGKLAFLRSVRSGRDPIFNNLALQFNKLVEKKFEFKIVEISDPEKNAINSLWIIETIYGEGADMIASQGSAFQLKDVGIITCAHVVSADGVVFEKLEIFKYSSPTIRYQLKVDRVCIHRDVAICSITVEDDNIPPEFCLEKATKLVETQDDIKLLGFPAYDPGHSYTIVDAKVAKTYTQSMVEKFEISSQIRKGNSGGPIINTDSMVVGVALEGASMDAGNNGCLKISELDQVLKSDDHKI